jgi:hypothetical protein
LTLNRMCMSFSHIKEGLDIVVIYTYSQANTDIYNHIHIVTCISD